MTLAFISLTSSTFASSTMSAAQQVSHRGFAEVDANVEATVTGPLSSLLSAQQTEVPLADTAAEPELPPVPADEESGLGFRHGSGARTPARASPKREARSVSTSRAEGSRPTSPVSVRPKRALPESEAYSAGTSAQEPSEWRTLGLTEQLVREIQGLKVRLDVLEGKETSELLSMHGAKFKRRLNDHDAKI